MKLQQCLVILVLACGAGVATAQTIENRLADCAGVEDEQQRLACFDDLVSSLRPAEGQVAPAAPPVTASTEAFGLEHKNVNADRAGELQAKVTGIYKNSLGQMLLILDNGQIWQQKDSKTLIIHKDDLVLIERGFMSAFYLTAKDKKRIKVARVK